MKTMQFIPITACRLPALATGLLALAACGGGGGDGGAADASSSSSPALVHAEAATITSPQNNASGPSVALSYGDCLSVPAHGTVSRYMNSARPRREWKAATFLGETATARHEYATLVATSPARIRYTKIDAATGNRVLLGVENFNASGVLTQREQYIGNALSSSLAPGATESIDYTVKTLFPAGVADRQARIVRNYVGQEAVNSTSGRVETCKVLDTVYAVSPAGIATQEYTEQLNYAKGVEWIKSYLTYTGAAAADRNQTYLVELLSSTAFVAAVHATADATPSLASCSAVPAGQTLRFSAFDTNEANSALRTTSVTVSNGVSVLNVDRRNVTTQALTRKVHFDGTVGLLREVAYENYNPSGAVTSAFYKTGVPDLSNLALGASASYTETSTQYLPTSSSSRTLETVKFLGHEKVTTPAGVFDTCKVSVKYTYAGGTTSTETYNYAPNLYWVRMETTGTTGVRTVRELVAK